MGVLDFLIKQKELHQLFRIDKNEILDDGEMKIQTFEFESGKIPASDECHASTYNRDIVIKENARFNYPVFIPPHKGKANSCILLFHGLNERNWDKYLCWAEYLASNTGKPVLMFPIAYHINRAPSLWSDPRRMSMLVDKRKIETGETKSLSFANAALSERLSEDPYRFYSSGRQTIYDITSLVRQIKNGEHPLFKPGTSVDIFAYSIGSFMAEILLMANPENLFKKTKLFIFCGGSIFNSMFGESRCIMDKPAYDKLLRYYCKEWFGYIHQSVTCDGLAMDNVLSAFNSMIMPNMFKKKREIFFASAKQRISGISLVKDSVMPFSGVEACMGNEMAYQCFLLIDFPYEYTHESPFPTNGRVDEKVLNASFLSVFQKAASFLL